MQTRTSVKARRGSNTGRYNVDFTWRDANPEKGKSGSLIADSDAHAKSTAGPFEFVFGCHHLCGRDAFGNTLRIVARALVRAVSRLFSTLVRR